VHRGPSISAVEIDGLTNHADLRHRRRIPMTGDSLIDTTEIASMLRKVRRALG
jgi:hypothetical protein